MLINFVHVFHTSLSALASVVGMVSFPILSFALAYAALVSGNPMRRAGSPTVKLNDNATVTGISSGSVSKFLGIPFAKPPTGDLRFRAPEPVQPYQENFDATKYGKSCPQQALTFPSIPEGIPSDLINDAFNVGYRLAFPDDEDCLSLNVLAPGNDTVGSNWPVLVWIYGGGFEIGGTIQYDGTGIVESSIVLGKPVIFVSMNYRVSAFGFLASKQVKAEKTGNFGLLDQRLALRWVKQYIAQFGGNPDNVTIWGESAGAVSVGLHMVANNNNSEGLFHAAFMESGSPIPVGDITNGQPYYDFLVSQTKCSDPSVNDTLTCLRHLPYEELKAAVDLTPSLFSYQSLALAWTPRVDGIFITDLPQKLVQAGNVTRIPFVTGDCDDEGTLFQFSTVNITTPDLFRDYVKQIWLPNATNTVIDQLLAYYPDDITEGSPYDTGPANALTLQSKRISSLIGDIVFQAPRRFFLEQCDGKQDMWSFLSKKFKVAPLLGSFHASDLLNVFFNEELTEILVRFAWEHNPNGGKTINWPKYTKKQPKLLTLDDSLVTSMYLTDDTYRNEAIAYVMQISLEHPL